MTWIMTSEDDAARKGWYWNIESMATLEQFKQLETNPEKLSELASQYIVGPETATAKIIQLAADKGFELTSEEISQFISQMNEDDEFDDLELSPEALSSVAGGGFYFHGIKL